MGTGSSKNPDSSSDEQGGGQLYVSLKMETHNLKGQLIPHVYGSWDALPMERESTCMWELNFVVPPNHETLHFNFLLKPKYSNIPCIVEEGPNRLLTRGTLRGDARSAIFRFAEDEELIEYRVFIKADRVSPFDLAASWRAFQENRKPSTVRGIPDVSMNCTTDLATEVFSGTDGSTCTSNSSKDGHVPNDRPAAVKEIEVIVPDPAIEPSSSGMVESKSMGSSSSLQKQDSHRGLLVDRGVGSPRLVKSPSSSTFTLDLKPDSDTKNMMPAAAGAVAAAAIDDQMLGPKEDRHLAIVLVGLPARGKTFTAAKLTRYLRWLGHDTKHFNVGKYQRLKHGTNQSTDFFRGDNPEGMEAHNEVAALAMEDMIAWMQEGGQVGIFDATNSTRGRRNMLMQMAEGKCKIIFLETICSNPNIIERNIRLKVQQSLDYAEVADFEAGYRDFKSRLDNYEKVYEPVKEGSYIKMIDMVTGHGGQIQVRIFLHNHGFCGWSISLSRGWFKKLKKCGHMLPSREDLGKGE